MYLRGIYIPAPLTWNSWLKYFLMKENGQSDLVKL